MTYGKYFDIIGDKKYNECFEQGRAEERKRADDSIKRAELAEGELTKLKESLTK